MAFLVPSRPLRLPRFVEHYLDGIVRQILQPQGGPVFDFTQPLGEEALIPPDSVSWQIFKNPVSMFIGGVAAVILELAEPAVRTGVWEHSSFRTDPLQRLRHTGLATMVTIYGARSTAEAMIADIVRIHERVRGETPAGETYHANDAGLLTWVQATACFGFAEAYSRYVHHLNSEQFDRLYAECAAVGELYGALEAPTSQVQLAALIQSKQDRLERSPIVFEFLDIMHHSPVLPAPLGPLQRMLVRAAVDITPSWVRERLGLTTCFGLRPWQKPLVLLAGALSDSIALPISPAVQSCLRVGLSADYLYRSREHRTPLS